MKPGSIARAEFVRDGRILWFRFSVPPLYSKYVAFRWYERRWGRWRLVQKNEFPPRYDEDPLTLAAGLQVPRRRRVRVMVFGGGVPLGEFQP